jgi:hypothetical protein
MGDTPLWGWVGGLPNHAKKCCIMKRHTGVRTCWALANTIMNFKNLSKVENFWFICDLGFSQRRNCPCYSIGLWIHVDLWVCIKVWDWRITFIFSAEDGGGVFPRNTGTPLLHQNPYIIIKKTNTISWLGDRLLVSEKEVGAMELVLAGQLACITLSGGGLKYCESCSMALWAKMVSKYLNKW